MDILRSHSEHVTHARDQPVNGVGQGMAPEADKIRSRCSKVNILAVQFSVPGTYTT